MMINESDWERRGIIRWMVDISGGNWVVLKNSLVTLAALVQWIECQPLN